MANFQLQKKLILHLWKLILHPKSHDKKTKIEKMNSLEDVDSPRYQNLCITPSESKVMSI